MTTQTDDIQEQTPEQKQQEAKDAESALVAGFNETRGVEPPPVEAPAITAEPKSAEPKAAEPKATDKSDDTAASAAAPAKSAVDSLSPEIKALIDKVPGLEQRLETDIRKLYGRLGNFERLIQQRLQSGRKIEKGALKRLSTEFPEIAEMIEQDLADVFGSVASSDATPEDKTADVDTRINAAVSAAVGKIGDVYERKLLTILHPKWEADCKTPEFGQFLETLPEVDRKKYLESTDALVSAQAFTQFYDWQKAKAKPQSEKSNDSARKQERLEQALTPSGDGAPPATTIDDEAAFVSGFKETRSSG